MLKIILNLTEKKQRLGLGLGLGLNLTEKKERWEILKNLVKIANTTIIKPLNVYYKVDETQNNYFRIVIREREDEIEKIILLFVHHSIIII